MIFPLHECQGGEQRQLRERKQSFRHGSRTKKIVLAINTAQKATKARFPLLQMAHTHDQGNGTSISIRPA